MKNRNLNHSDDWATPPHLLEELHKKYQFTFDPCPYNHNTEKWDGLEIDWHSINYVNPPYSRMLKEAFVKKAIQESIKGNTSIMLLPVSTSTKLFHDYILPNASDIIFLRSRVPFIGINTKGEYVNWHLWDRNPPEGSTQVKNSGMHDSMLVIFGNTI